MSVQEDFYKACEMGELSKVKNLLAKHDYPAYHFMLTKIAEVIFRQKYIDVTADGHRALRVAIHASQINIVDYLLKIPAILNDFAKHNNNIFELAVYQGDSDMMNRLLDIESVQKRAADNHNYILRVLIIRDELELIHRMLSLPAVQTKLSQSDSDSVLNELMQTALILAFKKGNHQALALLKPYLPEGLNKITEVEPEPEPEPVIAPVLFLENNPLASNLASNLASKKRKKRSAADSPLPIDKSNAEPEKKKLRSGRTFG